MEKFSVFLVKWIVIPGAIFAVGYFALGPRLSKAQEDSSAHPSAKVADSASVGDDTSLSANTTPSAPTSDAAKSHSAPVQDVPEAETKPRPTMHDEAPATDPTSPTKFDPDVSSAGVDVAPRDQIQVDVSKHGTDPGKAALAGRPKAKAKAKRKVFVGDAPKSTSGDESTTVVKHHDSGDDSVGEDVKSHPKTHEGKMGDPNLPKTPEDGGDSGN